MNPTPLRVAVIGAGPSGFYAADALLKAREDVSVDLFDRLPTPYGLVRYGVAPDHQRIKSVTRLYERTCRDPRVRFFGNVAYGRDLDHNDLTRHYHAIVYAVGAPSDRSLGIPGEDLPGSLSATEFVAWYNGHPDFVTLDPPLDAEQVAVIGVGNVAVDVTRILAKTPEELAATDMADYALDALAKSRVRDIYMLGRRGPAQAKFTTKELRELGELAEADIIVDAGDLEVDDASLASIEGDTIAQKNLEVLRDFAARTPAGKPRRIHLKFFVSPIEVHGSNRVEAMTLERNRLEPTDGGYLRAVGTGESYTLPLQLILRSVGYRGQPLPGVPFDERRAVIPNRQGRVLSAPDGEPLAGEYVVGWIKRGPTGVIGTNKADAMETVEALLSDELPSLAPEDTAPEAIVKLLEAKGVRFVTFEEYQALERYEVEAGKAQGRPRVKLTRLDEMLEHAHRD